MPQYLPTFRDRVRALVVATWPEVEANGVYLSRELARIPFDTLTLPIAVIDCDARPYLEGANPRREDLVTVTVSRVNHNGLGDDDGEDPDELLQKLEALRTAFWPDNRSHPITGAQVMEYPAVTDSSNLPDNRYFLNTAKPYYCGALIAKIRVGTLP